MAAGFHWLDVHRIAEELEDAFPDHDPAKVTFPRLKNLVEELDGFREQKGHPCNERILEEIQRLWIVERQDAVDQDEEDDDR